MGKRRNARDLIDAKKQKVGARNAFPPALVIELRKIMKSNDGLPRNERVSAQEACEMARDYGWIHGRDTFSEQIRRTFGRRWTRDA